MILLVGSGLMALEYAKILKAQNKEFIVVGRGGASAEAFFKETGVKVIPGGLDTFLAQTDISVDQSIVAVNADQLYSCTIALLQFGVKKILVEKPAALNLSEIKVLTENAQQFKAKLYVAYNRRFFSSVEAASQIIKEDGGVSSFTFEITEWSHIIETLDKSQSELENWFIANTSHVVDLAFFLGGLPSDLRCFTAGETKWHHASSKFVGAGVTSEGVLFSYHGDWQAPGRWGVEILTQHRRIILQPLEGLIVQNLGSIERLDIEIDNHLDLQYKPGLYNQVMAFLSKKSDKRLCLIKDHAVLFDHCIMMAAY